jgi:hypothetical protein
MRRSMLIVAFLRVFWECGLVHRESLFWASSAGFRFLEYRVGAISLYLNRLVGLRGSGRLVSIAFENSARLWEEVEFMHHATALPESCPPLTMVRGWFGDAVHILGRQYSPMGPFDQLPECDTAAIVAHMQRLYLTGPHRQGPVKAIYDSLQDGASHCCAPYIRSQYLIEAYRTLARSLIT